MKTGDTGPDRGAVAPVLLLLGSERWLRRQAVQRLKARCTLSGFEETDFVRFPEPPASPQGILEAIGVLPFGSAYRLVVVEGFDELSEKMVPWLAGYLARPNPRTCLALCAERLERGSSFLSELQRTGALKILPCEPLKAIALKGWMRDQAKALGKGIEPEAADLLATRLGSELGPLEQALESLGLLADSRPKITRSDVEALIAPSVRETAFDILDKAAAGRIEEALATLRQALLQGRLTVEQVMGALGWYYRMAWKSRTEGGSGSWINPCRQAALARLRRWPTSKLQQALEDLLQADTDLKLGHPAPDLLADRQILRLGANP